MFEGQNYINSNFIKSNGEFFTAFNPSTDEPYGKFPKSSINVVNDAVNVARKAFNSWKKISKIQRAELFYNLSQLLKQHHVDIQKTISIETGKNLNEAHAEIIEMLHMCQVVAGTGRQHCGEIYASELSIKDVQVIRKPKGVVAVISPWNFPLLGAFWCSAPAIIEGNTVVHKPSELTPKVNQLISELYHKAGFPPGVYNVIHGDGTTGNHLVHSDVDVILFTGSAEVGQLIRKHCAETWNKTCSCECGSKSAMIVFDGEIGDLALDSCLASAFKLSGQRCVSASRLLVQRSVLVNFIEKFIDLIRSKATFGDPFVSPPPFFGPLINKEQKDKVEQFNQMVRDDSDAEVLLDVLETSGNFIGPFVYKCEWGDKPFLKQEVFGPHLSIIPFDDVEDAIRIYNDTEYGLSLGIISNDYKVHRKIQQECIAGMLYINGSSVGAESHLPFSSWKKSGNSASASATWKAVTHTMAITTNYGEDLQFAQGMKL